jgi:hypothetical protein
MRCMRRKHTGVHAGYSSSVVTTDLGRLSAVVDEAEESIGTLKPERKPPLKDNYMLVACTSS